MKDIYNNTLKEVRLLMGGKIKALRFYKVKYTDDDCLDDERVLDAVNYLDGKGIFYVLKDIKDEKRGEGLEIELIKDNERIDCLCEDLNFRLLFGGLNRHEEKLLDKLDNMSVDTFHYFMTKEQIYDIRFDIIKYMVNDKFDFDVFYSERLVIIHSH